VENAAQLSLLGGNLSTKIKNEQNFALIYEN